MNASIHRFAAIAATIVVLAAVVWGFVSAGTPDFVRLERLDERRIDDLQAIVWAMQRHVRDPDSSRQLLKRGLPRKLEDLAKAVTDRKLSLTDPETGEPYEYEPTAWNTYRLCATFDLPRNATRRVFWNHPAGRHCFTIDVTEPP
jgi:hypothetical protein